MPENQVKIVKFRSQPFPVISLGDRQKPTRYGWGMAFVYAPNGNFVVNGESKKVEEYIKSTWNRCLYYMSWWGNPFPSRYSKNSRWNKSNPNTLEGTVVKPEVGKRWKTESDSHRGMWLAQGFSVTERFVKPSKRESAYCKKSHQERDQFYFSDAPKSAKFRISAKYKFSNIPGMEKVFYYRKLPKKWLKEWDILVP